MIHQSFGGFDSSAKSTTLKGWLETQDFVLFQRRLVLRHRGKDSVDLRPSDSLFFDPAVLKKRQTKLVWKSWIVLQNCSQEARCRLRPNAESTNFAFSAKNVWMDSEVTCDMGNVDLLVFLVLNQHFLPWNIQKHIIYGIGERWDLVVAIHPGLQEGSMTKFPWLFLPSGSILGSSSFWNYPGLGWNMFSCIETIDMRKHGQKVVYKRCLVIETPTKCCLQDGFVKLTVIRWLKTCEMNDSSWTMGQLSEFQIGEIVLISFCCVLFRLSEMVRDMCIYIHGKQFGSTNTYTISC